MSWLTSLFGMRKRVVAQPSIAPRRPYPANVPGPFYVQDGCCLACGVWEEVAEGLLAWDEESSYPHCYVARQPQSDGEVDQMIAAMNINEVDCLRVRICAPDWMKRPKDAGVGAQIDPPTCDRDDFVQKGQHD